MRKRLLAIIATVAMVAAMMPSMVFAAGGTGTANNPYLVENESEFKAALAAGGYVKLTGSFDVDEVVTLNDAATAVEVVLDLNGETITGTDPYTTSDGNFGLIRLNKGDKLTVKDTADGGAITLTAMNDNSTSRSSSVIENNQGTVIIEGGMLEHLGGHYMAYAIDNLTNSSIGDAYLTISGGTVISSYMAIRQYANCYVKENVVSITGGTVGSIFAQSPNSYENNAELNISEDAQIINTPGKKALYLWCDSSDNFEVSISGGSITGELDVQAPLNQENFITGGKFNTDVSEFLTNDSVLTSFAAPEANGENEYTVRDKEDAIANGYIYEVDGVLCFAYSEDAERLAYRIAMVETDPATNDRLGEDYIIVKFDGSNPVKVSDGCDALPEIKDTDTHKFLGWYIVPEDGLNNKGVPIKYGKKLTLDTVVTGDMMVFTKWEKIETPAKPEKSPNTGDNNMAPFAVAGLVLAAMAAVVASRRRAN